MSGLVCVYCQKEAQKVTLAAKGPWCGCVMPLPPKVTAAPCADFTPDEQFPPLANPEE